MEKYSVLYTTNSNYFEHMVTSIYSLLTNNKCEIFKINIIENGLTIEQKQLLYKLFFDKVEIKIYSMEKIMPIIEKYNIPKWRDSYVANARLFAFEIIKDANKLLYLDSDTIIKNSLEQLFQKKIEHPVAAVKDLCFPEHMKNLVDNYYNSGVLLIDRNLWENEHCIDLIFKFIRTKTIELIYPDQDILNVSLRGEIETLSPNYNINPTFSIMEKHPFLAKKSYEKLEHFYTYEEIKKSMKNPYIYHMLEYLGVRPWNENAFHPYNDIYDEYRKLWDIDYSNNNRISSLSKVQYLKMYLNIFLTPEKKELVKKLIHYKR